jgi:RNA polymerase sigma factor (sigma-70 family)
MPDDDFDAFFRSRYTDLVAFVMRLGARLDDAEEAAQEAMVAAYASWPRIRDPAAWTWRVAYRSFLAQVRRRRLREVLVPTEALYQRADPAEPEADLLWRDRFHRLLAGLAERQRRIVALWYEGYPVREIAGRLNVEPGTVRSAFRHARARLAGLFGDPSSGPDQRRPRHSRDSRRKP